MTEHTPGPLTIHGPMLALELEELRAEVRRLRRWLFLVPYGVQCPLCGAALFKGGGGGDVPSAVTCSRCDFEEALDAD